MRNKWQEPHEQQHHATRSILRRHQDGRATFDSRIMTAAPPVIKRSFPNSSFFLIPTAIVALRTRSDKEAEYCTPPPSVALPDIVAPPPRTACALDPTGENPHTRVIGKILLIMSYTSFKFLCFKVRTAYQQSHKDGDIQPLEQDPIARADTTKVLNGFFSNTMHSPIMGTETKYRRLFMKSLKSCMLVVALVAAILTACVPAASAQVVVRVGPHHHHRHYRHHHRYHHYR